MNGGHCLKQRLSVGRHRHFHWASQVTFSEPSGVRGIQGAHRELMCNLPKEQAVVSPIADGKTFRRKRTSGHMPQSLGNEIHNVAHSIHRS